MSPPLAFLLAGLIGALLLLIRTVDSLYDIYDELKSLQDDDAD